MYFDRWLTLTEISNGIGIWSKKKKIRNGLRIFLIFISIFFMWFMEKFNINTSFSHYHYCRNNRAWSTMFTELYQTYYQTSLNYRGHYYGLNIKLKYWFYYCIYKIQISPIIRWKNIDLVFKMVERSTFIKINGIIFNFRYSWFKQYFKQIRYIFFFQI